MKLSIVEANQGLDEEYQEQNNEFLADREENRVPVEGNLGLYKENQGFDEE